MDVSKVLLSWAFRSLQPIVWPEPTTQHHNHITCHPIVSLHIRSHDIMSDHIDSTSHHITSHHIKSHHHYTTSHDTRHTTPHDMTLHLATSRIASSHVTWRATTFVSSHLATNYLVTWQHVTSPPPTSKWGIALVVGPARILQENFFLVYFFCPLTLPPPARRGTIGILYDFSTFFCETLKKWHFKS